MGLYSKIDKQTKNYYEVVSINRSLSKQNIDLKNSISLRLIFNVFLIMKMFHFFYFLMYV